MALREGAREDDLVAGPVVVLRRMYVEPQSPEVTCDRLIATAEVGCCQHLALADTVGVADDGLRVVQPAVNLKQVRSRAAEPISA